LPADLQTKTQDARKAAVSAALARDATEANVKAKVDAVARIQAEITMLRYSKGLRPNMKNLTDEQKTPLNKMGLGHIIKCSSAEVALACACPAWAADVGPLRQGTELQTQGIKGRRSLRTLPIYYSQERP
jgi:hypothetical protein